MVHSWGCLRLMDRTAQAVQYKLLHSLGHFVSHLEPPSRLGYLGYLGYLGWEEVERGQWIWVLIRI